MRTHQDLNLLAAGSTDSHHSAPDVPPDWLRTRWGCPLVHHSVRSISSLGISNDCPSIRISRESAHPPSPSGVGWTRRSHALGQRNLAPIVPPSKGVHLQKTHWLGSAGIKQSRPHILAPDDRKIAQSPGGKPCCRNGAIYFCFFT